MFQLNPLVLGEVHDDVVSIQWIIDNIEDLYRAGYRCFANEYDKNISLDKMIPELVEEIEAIKTKYQNPAYINIYMEQVKRASLLNLFGTKKNAVMSFSTEKLMDLAKHIVPDVKEQLARHETAILVTFERTANLLPQKERMLVLLKKVKELGMNYVGLDDSLGEQRSMANTMQGTFDSQRDKRDVVITHRLACAAKIYDGAVIALVGARHLVGIAQLLPGEFETPFLRAEKESLAMFQFARIMNPDYEYVEEIEQELNVAFIKYSQTSSWFKFKQVSIKDADEILSTLAVDLERNIAKLN